MNMISRSNTLRDQAYQLIRNKIISQELPFGAKLSVADLSREFGISNSPIREAISLLEMDGLVNNVPNFGFSVIEFSQETLFEVAQCIKVIMFGSYLECVRNNQVEKLEKMLVDRYEFQKKSFTGEASFAYACAAIEFDKAFVDVTDNEMLIKLFDGKFNLLTMCVLYAYRDIETGVEGNFKEHKDILDAVRARDDDAVIQAIAKHYDKSNLDFEAIMASH